MSNSNTLIMIENMNRKFDLPGKLLLVLTAFFMFGFTNMLHAQSNCVKADFSVTVDQTSLTAKFVATASSNAILFTWDFGSGSTVNGLTTSKTYSAAGNYKVCLTVYGVDASTGQKCSTVICKTVEIRKCELKADFTLTTDGLNVKVEGKSSSNHAVYGYTFGDGTGERGINAKHAYNKDGKYKICLYVKDTVTGCTAEVCKEVELRKCKLEADFTIITDGLSVKLVGKSSSNHAVYGYTFSNGGAERGREIKYTFKAAGEYKICFHVKDTVTGCVTEICKGIDLRKCKIEGDFEFGQDGNDFKFRAKSSDVNATYVWNFGDKTEGKGSEIKHTYSSPGVYEVCVTIISSSSSTTDRCTTKVCKKVEIKDCDNGCKLRGNFSYSLDGLSIKVKAESNEDGVLFYWSWGDGSTAEGLLAKNKFAKDGTYEICLVIFNPKTKCKIVVCKKLVIEKPCKLKADFKLAIDGSKVMLKARSNGSQDVEFYWNFGDGKDGKGSPIRHEYSAVGTYVVTLTAYDKRTGCKFQVEKKIIINKRVLSIPDAEVETDVDIKTAVQVEAQVPSIEWTATAFPIPSHNAITFSSDQKIITHATIYTSNGNKVLDVNVNTNANSNNEVDITTLPTGLYIAHVTAVDGSVKIVKFLKN